MNLPTEISCLQKKLWASKIMMPQSQTADDFGLSHLVLGIFFT